LFQGYCCQTFSPIFNKLVFKTDVLQSGHEFTVLTENISVSMQHQVWYRLLFIKQLHDRTGIVSEANIQYRSDLGRPFVLNEIDFWHLLGTLRNARHIESAGSMSPGAPLPNGIPTN
jgi:hypothetical protein